MARGAKERRFKEWGSIVHRNIRRRETCEEEGTRLRPTKVNNGREHLRRRCSTSLPGTRTRGGLWVASKTRELADGAALLVVGVDRNSETEKEDHLAGNERYMRQKKSKVDNRTRSNFEGKFGASQKAGCQLPLKRKPDELRGCYSPREERHRRKRPRGGEKEKNSSHSRREERLFLETGAR